MKDTKQDGSFGSLLGIKLLACTQTLNELESEILTLTDVANLIGVSRRTCTNYRNDLKLPFVRIGSKTVFFRSEVLIAIRHLRPSTIEKGEACRVE